MTPKRAEEENNVHKTEESISKSPPSSEPSAPEGEDEHALKQPPIDHNGEIPHYKHYDVRIASQGYANIATVLAGFAFAAIVLVIEPPHSSASVTNASTFHEWATIAFLVSFLGGIISAFTFSVVMGEELLAPRSHATSLLGGAALAISTGFIFWALATLLKIYLPPNITYLAAVFFVVIAWFSPLYLIYSATDPIKAFKFERISVKKVLRYFSPVYLPLLISTSYRLLGFQPSINTLVQLFNPLIIAALIIIIAGAVLALFASDAEHMYFLNLNRARLWIAGNTLIFGVLILFL